MHASLAPLISARCFAASNCSAKKEANRQNHLLIQMQSKAKEHLASDDPPEWEKGFADEFPVKVGKWVDSATLLAVQLSAIKRSNAMEGQGAV